MVRASISRGKQAGLVVDFLWSFFGGIAHSGATDTGMKIVPPWIPWPCSAVLVSGVFELLGAADLLWRPTHRDASAGLILLAIAVMPRQIYVLQRADLFASIPLWALWWCLPIEEALLALTARCKRAEREDRKSMSYYRAIWGC